MNRVDRGDQLRAQVEPPRVDKERKAYFFDLIQVMLCNVYIPWKHAPTEAQGGLKDSVAFRQAIVTAFIRQKSDWGVRKAYPCMDWWYPGNETLPRYEIRGQEVYQRAPMPRRTCRVCWRNNKCIKRGLDTGRVPLSEVDPNIVPRISWPASGCSACGVSLCKHGKCWETYHSSLRGIQAGLDGVVNWYGGLGGGDVSVA